MRRLAIGGGISVGIVAMVACATSEEEPRPSAEPEPSIVDASVQEVLGTDDADIDAHAPRCSPGGWCETILPDVDLALRDIWPLPDRAFAIADSFNSGIRVLEWTAADSTWRYIDDNSQNEQALADFAVKIWAPNADEVYYAVSPGIVFYGRRPVPPATAWSWSSSRLEDNNSQKLVPDPQYADSSIGTLTLGVWGPASDTVYAWYSNTVFRGVKRSDGTIEWIVEFVADDFGTASEQLLITGVAGTQGDDLWFAGSRRVLGDFTCAIVVRKTSEGYLRVADGTSRPCTARGDGGSIPLVVPNVGLPMQLQSSGSNRILFRNLSNKLVQIAAEGEGYSVRESVVPSETLGSVRSLWGESKDLLWLGGAFDPSHGVTARGERIWDDAGTYQLSSAAIHGLPPTPSSQIRGTSTGNIWMVGDRYALHKTSP